MNKIRRLCFWLAVLMPGLIPAQALRPPGAGEYHYGIEINGVLCGYAEFSVSPLGRNEPNLVLLKETIVTRVRALGQSMESRMVLTYHLDSAMRRFVRHDFLAEQGPTRLESKMRVDGSRAYVSGDGVKGEETVTLPPDVILSNPLYYPHLVEDFALRGLESKTYAVFDGRDGRVQDIVYTKVKTESLRLPGREYQAVVLDLLNRTNGMKYRMWLDAKSGILLQTVLANRRQYLADASVMARALGSADMDVSLTVKANKLIPDFRNLSYLRVRAVFEPSGLWITPDSLSVPGQRFTGTVKDNLVEGDFEIEHRRYDGAGALPFPPPDLNRNAALKEFLKASDMIQSDDPVLIAKAREIAEGSRDSWEAARRLARWVGENIKGAIPGGGTARGTYDSRSGECGGHSFLVAAFCRGLGIPARVVWGCQYTSDRGGMFAQHAWNEIYMGEAGWIPLDSTMRESDYVDSGHIRLGVHQSTATGANARRVEILDYRTAPEKAVRKAARAESAGRGITPRSASALR